MITSPEKGDCRDRTQGYVFRVHFQPLRPISIQKGAFHSAYMVDCKVRASAKPQATLRTLGQREKSSEWTCQALESCAFGAILVTALGTPDAE